MLDVFLTYRPPFFLYVWKSNSDWNSGCEFFSKKYYKQAVTTIDLPYVLIEYMHNVDAKLNWRLISKERLLPDKGLKEDTMTGEHVMTKCSLERKADSCANPFSGVCVCVCGGGAAPSALPCFKRNCLLRPAATVPLSYPFTAVSNYTPASLYKQVAQLL